MGDCGGKSPGPAYKFGTLTGFVGHDYTKPRAPAYSLGLRTDLRKPNLVPGPYSVGNVYRNGKAPYQGWTIELRSGLKHKSIGPGPLNYYPKVPNNAPAYSLGLKLGSKAKPFGPSAADYLPLPPGNGPAYTIGMARKYVSPWTPPGPQPDTPLERYKNRAPAYSLGLRYHDKYIQQSPGPIYLPGKCCRHHVPHAYSFGLKHHKCAPPLITYEDQEC